MATVLVGSVKGNVSVKFHGNRKFKSEKRNTVYSVVRLGKGGMSVIRSSRTGRVYSLPVNTSVYRLAK